MKNLVAKNFLVAIVFWSVATLSTSGCTPSLRAPSSLTPKGVLSSIGVSTPGNQSSFLYTVGDAVSITPQISGTATNPITFAISPALPAGLTFDSATGQISGTALASQNTTTYTLTTSGQSETPTSLQFSMTFYVAPTISVAGSPFIYNVGGAISPLVPTLSSSVSQVAIMPALPSGLSMSNTTGEIQGTPSLVSSATTYTLTATNPAGATASTTVSIQINPNDPIMLLQTAPMVNLSGVTSGTVTLPNQPKAGNFVAVMLWGFVDQTSDLSGATGTDNFGNTYSVADMQTFDDNGGFGFGAILYSTNISYSGAGSLTVTISFPSAVSAGHTIDQVEIAASEFQGIATTSPLDQLASPQSVNSSVSMPATLTTGSTATTTKSYELILSNISSDSDSDTYSFNETGSPTFAALTSITDSSIYMIGQSAYSIVTATGSYQRSLNASNLDSTPLTGYAGVLATFKGLQTGSNLAPASQIAFSASGQTLTTHQCFGQQILLENASAQAVTMTSALSITLSGTGLRFYSDSACSSVITTTSIAAYQSSSPTFYLAADIPGADVATATTASFTPVTQTETVTLINGTWLGTAGDNNWATASNWSGATVPTGSMNAYFDSNCTSCDANITDLNEIHVSLFMEWNYTGTVTQTVNNGTVGSVNLGGGTFDGSPHNMSAININITGGTFKAPPGTLTVLVSLAFSAGTFNANGGTVQTGTGSFDGVIGLSSVGSGTLTLNNLHLVDKTTGGYPLVISGTVDVAGDLTIDMGSAGGGDPVPIQRDSSTLIGNLSVAGNVTANTCGGGGGYNAGTIILSGNNNTQTLTGAADGLLPNIVIAHTGSGGVDLAGTIAVQGWNYNSGTVNAGTSTVQFGSGNSTLDSVLPLLNPGTMVFNDVVFNWGNINGLQLWTDMHIGGDLTVNNPGGATVTFAQNSNIAMYLSGNLSLEAGGISKFVPATFIFTGSGSQTVSQTGGTMDVPVEIDKTGGSVALSTAFEPGLYDDFTIVNGTLDTFSSAGLTVQGTLTIDAGGTVSCNTGCGAGPVTTCSGDMACTSLVKHGTITP